MLFQEKTYTIVAIDPDAPLHFKGEAVLHWLLSNVKGQDLATGNMSGTTFQGKYVWSACWQQWRSLFHWIMM